MRCRFFQQSASFKDGAQKHVRRSRERGSASSSVGFSSPIRHALYGGVVVGTVEPWIGLGAMETRSSSALKHQFTSTSSSRELICWRVANIAPWIAMPNEMSDNNKLLCKWESKYVTCQTTSKGGPIPISLKEPSWETWWPYLNGPGVLQMRATARAWDDTEKYGS